MPYKGLNIYIISYQNFHAKSQLRQLLHYAQNVPPISRLMGALMGLITWFNGPLK
jgi:hypothetical protein